MKRFYAIQPEFYEVLSKHKDVLASICTLSEKQRDKILVAIDIVQILESAQSFFQEEVQVYQHTMVYEEHLKSKIHLVEFKDGYVQMENLKNPLYELLKRKHRHFLIEDV